MLKFDPETYDKLTRYCAYQERAISEVREKMKKLGVVASLYDEYLKELQDEGFQNELRFAESYVSGKLRIKGWGLRKISMHLKQKRVAESIIRQVLVADSDYHERLGEIVERRLSRTSGKDEYARKSKVYRYLLQRGYDSGDIRKLLFD